MSVRYGVSGVYIIVSPACCPEESSCRCLWPPGSGSSSSGWPPGSTVREGGPVGVAGGCGQGELTWSSMAFRSAVWCFMSLVSSPN